MDWCEDNKVETIRTNVIGCLNVAGNFKKKIIRLAFFKNLNCSYAPWIDMCEEKKLYHLLYATGCIFEYDNDHVIGGKGFLEEDKANFHGSFYSHTKVLGNELYFLS